MAQVGMRCKQLAEPVRKANALAPGARQHLRQFSLKRRRYAELVLNIVLLLDDVCHGLSLVIQCPAHQSSVDRSGRNFALASASRATRSLRMFLGNDGGKLRSVLAIVGPFTGEAHVPFRKHGLCRSVFLLKAFPITVEEVQDTLVVVEHLNPGEYLAGGVENADPLRGELAGQVGGEDFEGPLGRGQRPV